MPLSSLCEFVVHPVVALDEYGDPIPLDQKTSQPVCSMEPTTPEDPNVVAWGVYGSLSGGELHHLADCPSFDLATVIAKALSQQITGRSS